MTVVFLETDINIKTIPKHLPSRHDRMKVSHAASLQEHRLSIRIIIPTEMHINMKVDIP